MMGHGGIGQVVNVLTFNSDDSSSNRFELKIYFWNIWHLIAAPSHLVLRQSRFKPCLRPGASPIKILQRKFYATLIFKHLDWLIN